jgi:hypothetical protein
VAGLLGDPAYLQSVLAGLPGVDPNDPALQATLRNLQVRLLGCLLPCGSRCTEGEQLVNTSRWSELGPEVETPLCWLCVGWWQRQRG